MRDDWNACFQINSDVIKTYPCLYGYGRGGDVLPAPFLAHAKRLVADLENAKKPRIGFIDMQYCRNLVLVNYEILHNSVADVFGLKMYLHRHKIRETEALYAARGIFENFKEFSSLLKHRIYDVDQAVHYVIYVIIYGCDATTYNIYELEQIARFWELINRWAVAIKIRVFIASAVEDAFVTHNKTPHSCGIKDPYMNSFDKSCDSGRWRAMAIEPETNTTSSNYVFYDKRSNNCPEIDSRKCYETEN